MPQQQLDYREPSTQHHPDPASLRRRVASVLLVTAAIASALWALSYLSPINQRVFVLGDTAYWFQSHDGSFGVYARWFWMPGKERAVFEVRYWHLTTFLVLLVALVAARELRHNPPMQRTATASTGAVE